MHYIYKFIGEKDEIIYIGRTTNMHNRMAQHKSTSKWKCTKRILYAKIESGFDCGLIESYMIVKHKPEFNIAHNIPTKTTGLKIELPEFEDWTPKKEIIEGVPQEWDDTMLSYLEINDFVGGGDFGFYENEDFFIGTNFIGANKRYIVNHFLWDSAVFPTPPSSINTLNEFIEYQNKTYEKFSHNVPHWNNNTRRAFQK